MKKREPRAPLTERLRKGLKEIEEWSRGERDDLRVTVLDDEQTSTCAEEAVPEVRKKTA